MGMLPSTQAVQYNKNIATRVYIYIYIYIYIQLINKSTMHINYTTLIWMSINHHYRVQQQLSYIQQTKDFIVSCAGSIIYGWSKKAFNILP